MTSFSRFRAVLLSVGLTALGASSAYAAATDWSGDARAQVRLVTASDMAGAGRAVEAAIEFRYAPNWHGYWRTPGDAGIAPVFDWSGSRNFKDSAVAWPMPMRLVVSGLQNSVYEGTFALPVTIERADAGAAAEISLAVDYAACSNICVPVHADLSLNFPVGEINRAAEAPIVAAARAKVPGPPVSAGIDVLRSFTEGDGSAMKVVAELRSTAAPFKAPDLFVEGAGDGLPPAPSVQFGDDGRSVTLTEPLPAGRTAAAPLTLTLVDGDRSAEFTIPSVTPAPQSSREAAGPGLIAILATALFGGLILNLMPCVLPILSIKLFGLARHAGSGRRAVRLGFVATSLGIVSCFLVLASVLIAIKLSGSTIGWGIQFQQPWFLAGMAVLTVLFAASFFEWLPIGVPQVFLRLSGTTSRVALVEAFLAGVFSTLLATPCSAPFVGTAVGFALAQGPQEILAVFFCLGLGMAAPFLGAAMFPGLVSWLPRPGAWMLRLRQGLGVLLLATAVWLLVVLASVAGSTVAAVVALLLATLLGLRFWITTYRRAEEQSWPRLATAALAAVALAVAFLPASGGTGLVPDAAGWAAFDPEALDRAVAEGKTVLVDVSASWCLTCKVNDVTALDTEAVRARLTRPGTIRMRADWSRPNPVIAAYLHRFARFGIPLDVVYGPSSRKGEALSELLTTGAVIEALDRAAQPS